MSEWEITQEEELIYDEKYDKMDKLFPNLKWCADTDHLDMLDEVITKYKDAIVYYIHNEYYYSLWDATPHEFIYIKKDRPITYRDVYLACESKWEYDNGDHTFLEGMYCNNGTQIELEFGS